jgi:glutaconate CoA-transferase subunit A
MNPTAATDLTQANPQYRTITDPYSGGQVVVVPALNPDVAIVHVQRADESGNAHIWGIIGEQKEAAFAADRVILTAEEIVSEEQIRLDPNRTQVPGFVVDAVCHIPYCAHPSYTQGYYDRDNAFYLEWDQISRTAERLDSWLDEWVYGVRDRSEYWQKLGSDIQNHLKVKSKLSTPVDYGQY